MTPLGRVARVLAELSEPEIGPFDGGVDAVWPSYIADARAVLQAIREPSMELVREAVDRAEDVIAPGDYREFWIAMIDAALEEG